jgi:uncharacterized membrane protein HdeD (DUF308 family)
MAEVTVTNPREGKSKIVMGIAALIMGVFFMVASTTSDSNVLLVIGLIVAIFGFVSAVIGRMQHWYHAE